MPDRPEQAGRSELSDRPFFVSPLTPRQTSVLQLRAHGLSEREIGHLLVIAAGTVQKHLSAARERLGAVDTPHAVALAMHYGFISLDQQPLPKQAPPSLKHSLPLEQARRVLGPIYADLVGG